VDDEDHSVQGYVNSQCYVFIGTLGVLLGRGYETGATQSFVLVEAKGIRVREYSCRRGYESCVSWLRAVVVVLLRH
jgi:hypothetical protein